MSKIKTRPRTEVA